jgi:hypothetical protein
MMQKEPPPTINETIDTYQYMKAAIALNFVFAESATERQDTRSKHASTRTRGWCSQA